MAFLRNLTSKPPSESVKGTVTILIALHLLTIGVMVFGYHRPGSRLMNRAYALLLPYTQLLHLDPAFAKLELTSGDGVGENHFLQVDFLPPIDSGDDRPTKSIRQPSTESKWSLGRHRWQAIAADGADFAKTENEGVAIAYVTPVLERLMREHQAPRGRIKFVLKKLPPLDPESEPTLPADDFEAAPYFETVFTAEGWFDARGQFQIQQVNIPRQVAPRPATSATVPE